LADVVFRQAAGVGLGVHRARATVTRDGRGFFTRRGRVSDV
jgi:hypothetical protein